MKEIYQVTDGKAVKQEIFNKNVVDIIGNQSYKELAWQEMWILSITVLGMIAILILFGTGIFFVMTNMEYTILNGILLAIVVIPTALAIGLTIPLLSSKNILTVKLDNYAKENSGELTQYGKDFLDFAESGNTTLIDTVIETEKTARNVARGHIIINVFYETEDNQSKLLRIDLKVDRDDVKKIMVEKYEILTVNEGLASSSLLSPMKS